MPTTQDLMKTIGTTLRHSFQGLEVVVEVVDAKVTYGKRRLQVKVCGQPDNKSTIWIER